MSTHSEQGTDHEDVDATGAFEVKATAELEELEKQHEGLMSSIATLKEDVQKWQRSIESEAKDHSQALDKIRSDLRGEVDALRSEFQNIKQSIQREMAQATHIESHEPSSN